MKWPAEGRKRLLARCAALGVSFDSWVYEITLFAPGILFRNTLRSLKHIIHTFFKVHLVHLYTGGPRLP